ncbi:flagellar protein FlaG [Echinimonas agarilytica]|uniref:Flagellar protein FlaG n=1 Tax=Echinimonas agarilytica TaxID=1215918 RepID=A0AA42B6X6_9GAMM|nr:flagellar protein FlaG [Echinimonas agarilytica]MCM2678956.1 flagellar protein FlaG [Echinimonas agarilytica]
MAIEANVATEVVAALTGAQSNSTTGTAQHDLTASEIAEQKAVAASEKIQEAGQNAENLTPEQLEVVVQQLQDFVSTLNRGIAFQVDDESGKDVIKVTNRDTGELVRQIPSEEVLLLAARLSEATGLLVNTEV